MPGRDKFVAMLWLPVGLEIASSEYNLMKTTTNRSVVIAFIVVLVALALFGGRAMTAGIMNGGVYESGWMTVQGWMWTPASITLGLGVVLGWFIFKKRV